MSKSQGKIDRAKFRAVQEEQRERAKAGPERYTLARFGLGQGGDPGAPELNIMSKNANLFHVLFVLPVLIPGADI
jgi:hypothetical protein